MAALAGARATLLSAALDRCRPQAPLYRDAAETWSNAGRRNRQDQETGSSSRARCVILVEPQLGDNIGAAARAMANFGLSRLRLVKPREGWPNRARLAWRPPAPTACSTSAELFDSVEAAIADCTFVLATTARAHDQAKPVVDAGGGRAR